MLYFDSIIMSEKVNLRFDESEHANCVSQYRTLQESLTEQEVAD